MGIFGDIADIGGDVLGYTPLGLGYRAATDEGFRSKIPGLNELTGAKSNEEKALLQKQEELAKEARFKQQQMQQARMNALGQSLLAFNPQNQMMAQMFGPQAAFSPEQFAQMAQNPIPNQTQPGDSDAMAAQQVQNARSERERQARIRQQMQPLPQTPAPFNGPRPQPGRRF